MRHLIKCRGGRSIRVAPDGGPEVEAHRPRMDTFFAAVTIAIVVCMVALAVWVFVIAPWQIPNRRA